MSLADVVAGGKTRAQLRAEIMGPLEADAAAAPPPRLPPPPPPLAEYQGPVMPLGEPLGEFLASDLFKLTVFCDPDAPVPAAQAELATLQAAVSEAVGTAKASDLEAKAQRLASDLAATQAALATAQQVQKDGLKAARRALAEGNSPVEHEQRYQDAARQETVLGNRISALSYLAEEARRAAASQARQAVLGVMDRARQDITDRRRQRLAEAVKALEPFLPGIGALDRVESELWNFQTGGLPAWTEALLAGEPLPAPPKANEPPAAAAGDDTAAARRRERINRVAALRSQGFSLRSIAEQLGMSLASVQRDLEKAGVSAPEAG
jgi:hypothetical protein